MDEYVEENVHRLIGEYQREMEVFSFHKALQAVFEIIAILNRYIDSEAPWKLAKEGDVRLKTVLYNIWNSLRITALLLYPFMPTKSGVIWNALGMDQPMEKLSFDDEKTFYFTENMGIIDKIKPV